MIIMITMIIIDNNDTDNNTIDSNDTRNDTYVNDNNSNDTRNMRM